MYKCKKGNRSPLFLSIFVYKALEGPVLTLFLTQLKNMNYRLRIKVLLELRSSPIVLPISLSCPVEAGTSPSKIYCNLLSLPSRNFTKGKLAEPFLSTI